MEVDEYAKMAEVEDRMWWYRGLHRHLQLVLERFLPRGASRVLDLGCGTGGFLRRAVRTFPGLALVGLDAWGPACALTRARTGRPVVRGLADRVPLADAAVDAILSADVICHRSVDPRMAAGEAWRCLRPGGIFIVHVPAYDWMHSYHDVRVETAKRFTRSSLGKLLGEAGFTVSYTTYWNSLLFPLMVLRRLVVKPRDGASDVHPYPASIEAVFGGVMAAEGGFLRAGGRFPFGGSVLAVGTKRHG
jgi:SAM-dependent methyltransferase